ncbi:hypothetical protein Tco_0023319, partial [Tanacetum coccineum]
VLTKVPAKPDVAMTEQGTKKRKGGHMKMLARKRKRPQSDVDSDDEHKTFKAGQTRTRERKKCTRAGRMLSKGQDQDKESRARDLEPSFSGYK